MGLRPDLERTPLFGVGCAAGAVGLARAADLARARPGTTVALVAVELCSLTHQTEEFSAKNIVGTALFGDGAACLVVRDGEGRGPRVVDHRSHTFPDSTDVMGWRIGERGLELVLSKELPALVEGAVGPLVRSFLARHGLKTADVDHFVVHPGGPKVVDAIERCLDVAGGTLDRTRRFLRAHGNLSSASVLFILQEVLASGVAEAGDRGLVLAFGPGFSAELVLLEW
jgi:alkylresorcinol/alkylpyrone synthase